MGQDVAREFVRWVGAFLGEQGANDVFLGLDRKDMGRGD